MEILDKREEGGRKPSNLPCLCMMIQCLVLGNKQQINRKKKELQGKCGRQRTGHPEQVYWVALIVT